MDAPIQRQRLRRATVFLLVLAVQFGIFEAALRTWGSSEAAPAFQGLFTGDEATGYRLLPGGHARFTTAEFDAEIAINGQGVRDDEEIGPKQPGERRIVILGDSLVLSVQVQFGQTFGEILEHKLNAEQSRYRYRVINAGVQGYGPVEELLFFRNVASKFEPDLVITTLFVGNDAEEAVSSEPKLAGGARPTVAALKEGLTTRLRRIVRRSMVLQILRLRAVAATERFTQRLSRPEPPLQSYAADPAPRIAHGLDLTRQCVEAISTEARAQGAQTALLLMPARFQVDDADYGRLRENVSQAGGELRRDAASERFDAALASLPLPRLDVLPALRAALPGPDLFFQQTVHLTPRGHQVVADALERFLRERRLVGDGER